MVRYHNNFTNSEWLVIVSIFVGSLLLRILIISPSQFDGLYGQDSYAYYDYAQAIKSSLLTTTPLPPFFWPLGYPFLLAISQMIFGVQPIVAQSITLILGTALAPLVYFLARQLRVSKFGSLTSALVMTFCGQALQSSVVIMSDIPALFWGSLSSLCLVRYLNTSTQASSTRWLRATVILLTFAIVTRWLYLLLIIPYTVATLVTWQGRIHWRDIFATVYIAGLVFLPQWLHSRTNPAPTINHEWVASWSPANTFSQSFNNSDGRFDYEKPNIIYYAQPYFDTYYLAPILTPFGVIGLYALWRKRSWQTYLITSWAIIPYLFLSGIPYQNIRFPLIVSPAVAILVGFGFDAFASLLHQVSKPKLVQFFLTNVLILALGIMWSRANETISVFITNQQRDKLVAQWASKYIPIDATVYSFGLTLTLKHYTALNVYELYYETPQSLAAKSTTFNTEYLLINVWNIENQWVGREPQLDYHWLRDERGIEQVGRYGNYTLFKIRG